MKNTKLRIISFKQSQQQPEYLYGVLDDEMSEIGDIVYHRENGAFTAIQKVLHHSQLKRDIVVMATNNPAYELPRIPDTFVKAYFEGGKEQKIINLRLK